MTELASRFDSLAALACPEGGWGYAPGQDAHLEPTCLALLALAGQRERYAAVIASGEAWLRRAPSATAPIGWDAAGTRRPGRRRWCCSRWRNWGRPRTNEIAQRRGAAGPRAAGAIETDGEDDDQRHRRHADRLALGGGNFSWVEPTAWACLALTRSGRATTRASQEGRKLLLDRVLENGGVNYGNRRIFGISLEPIPTPTSLTLLALQGQTDDRASRRSLDYLRKHALHVGGPRAPGLGRPRPGRLSPTGRAPATP